MPYRIRISFLSRLLRRGSSRIRRAQSLGNDGAVIAAAQGAFAARRGLKAYYDDLWDVELQVFSQWGEDGILDFLCDSLGIAKPSVIEIGAGDFSECNSRFLAVNRAASVVAIDARDDLEDGVMRSGLAWRTSVHALHRWMTPRNAPDVFSEAVSLLHVANPDVLSLDIDGVDYWVAEALDLSGVNIVVVEYNPLFGHRRAVTVPSAEHFNRSAEHFSWLYYGASLRAWVHLLGKYDLEFVGSNRAGNNAFFVPRNRRSEIPVTPVDHEQLDRYVQWNVRESRDERGRLSYLSGINRVRVMESMWVVDVINGERVMVADLHQAT